MIEICFEYDPRGWNRDLWLYLITGFEVQGYERKRDKDMKGNHFGTIAIDSIAELPKKPIIILAPLSSSNFTPEISLLNFVHPPEGDAIYYFGSDRENIELEEFKGKDITTVYIPQPTNLPQNELWSHQAGAIVLYDIIAKR